MKYSWFQILKRPHSYGRHNGFVETCHNLACLGRRGPERNNNNNTKSKSRASFFVAAPAMAPLTRPDFGGR